MSKGLIYLLLSTIIYSSISVMIRAMNAGHLAPMTQTFLRYIFAFLAAATYFKLTKSKFSVKKSSIVLLILVAIFGYALTNLAFTYAIIYTQISSALFIFYCFAIITPILGVIFLKERLSKYLIIALLISFFGLLLLFRPNSIATWKIGGIFALAAAFGQSFFVIARKKLVNLDSKLILLVSTCLGVIIVGLMAIFFEKPDIAIIGLNTWLVVILAGVGNFLAWLLMSKGFQLVKASTGSLVMLLENILAIGWGFAFFAEIPTLYTLFGGLLILWAAVLVIATNK